MEENVNNAIEIIKVNDIRLNKSGGVQRLLARVVNELRRDEISCDKARTIGYLANILLKSIEGIDHEERITELEKRGII